MIWLPKSASAVKMGAGVTNEIERQKLRAELDAIIAHPTA